jgi:hypothetical protein
VIEVVVADSRWSSNDGGESHMVDPMLMEVACFRLRDCEIAGDGAAVRSCSACRHM